MGYFVQEYIETQASGCKMYLVRPNFTPRPAGSSNKATFEDLLNSAAETGNVDFGKTDAQKQTSLESLTDEQRSALQERLNHGQGDLSLQEWDDFLADLVDLGLISNNDRMHANGILNPVTHDALSVFLRGADAAETSSNNPPLHDILNSWDGDPLKWLDALDLYMLKENALAELDGITTGGYSSQRNSCAKVSEIVRSLLAG